MKRPPQILRGEPDAEIAVGDGHVVRIRFEVDQATSPYRGDVDPYTGEPLPLSTGERTIRNDITLESPMGEEPCLGDQPEQP